LKPEYVLVMPACAGMKGGLRGPALAVDDRGELLSAIGTTRLRLAAGME
jgi:hypothetical protein